MKTEHNKSRRNFIKTAAKVAYVAPVVLSLSATPALAGQGSKRCDRKGDSYQSDSYHR